MKLLKSFVVVIAAMLLIAGCKKEYEAPTVTLDVSSENIFVDFIEGEEVIAFNVNVKAEAGIDRFQVIRYHLIGTEIESNVEIVTDSEAWKDKTEYTYEFNQTLTKADFEGGITSMEFEFSVKDNEGEEASKVLYVYYDEVTFTVTFSVHDAMGEEIENAVITFNGEEYEAGEYVFEDIVEGEYAYTVSKEGYLDATGLVEVIDEDVEVNVTLYTGLSEYSENVVIGNTHQNANANYNGEAAVRENTTIGIKYRNTDAGIIRIEKTEESVEWAIIDNDENITYYEDVITAFNEGELVTEDNITLNVDDLHKNKAYETKYFISKVGDYYYLIHYVAGQRSPEHGNVVVFQYKTKVD